MAEALTWVEDMEDVEVVQSDLEELPLGNRMECGRKKSRGRVDGKESAKERRRAKKKARQERIMTERKGKLESVTEEEEAEEEPDTVRMKSAVVVLSDVDMSQDGVDRGKGEKETRTEDDVLQLDMDTDDDGCDVRTYAGVVKGGPTDGVSPGTSGATSTSTTGMIKDIRSMLKSKSKTEVMDGRGKEKGGNGKEVERGKSIWRSVKQIKKWMDELEDEGARRETVRKVRSELDEILEQSMEKTEREMTEAQGDESEIEQSSDGGKMTEAKSGKSIKVVVEKPKRKVVLTEGRKEGPVEKRQHIDVGQWMEERIGEITSGDLQIQLYEGKFNWTLEMIKEAFWERGRLADEGIGRGELDRWRLIRRQRVGELDESNFIIRLPLRSYRCLTRGLDNRVKVEGKWVRYGKYVDVPTCWKCSGYGHMRGACRGAERCRKCGGTHLPTTCQTDVLRCVHCTEVGADDTGHRAISSECGTHLALIERKRQRIADYVDSL